MRQDTPFKKLYRSIHELTLDKFITCLCDSDYTVLILPNATATAQEIVDAWSQIYEQYIDCIQDTEQKHLIKLSREINILTTKLNLINLIIERLNVKHSDEILHALRQLINVPGKFDANDREQYAKDLKVAISLSKMLYVQLQEKEHELGKIMPTKAGKIERSHFDALIINVSKYMKFQINRREITVGEFIAMMIDMRNSVNRMQRELKTSKK